MVGIVEIEKLLKSMSPKIQGGEYAFCSVNGSYSEYAHLRILASFVESEGLKLIVTVDLAEKAHLTYEGKFK